MKKIDFKIRGIGLMTREVKPSGTTGHVIVGKKHIGRKVYVVVQ